MVSIPTIDNDIIIGPFFDAVLDLAHPPTMLACIIVFKKLLKTTDITRFKARFLTFRTEVVANKDSFDFITREYFTYPNGWIHGEHIIYTYNFTEADHRYISRKDNYVDGVRHGESFEFDCEGNYLMVCRYINGQRQGKAFCNPNIYLNYVDDVIQGEAIMKTGGLIIGRINYKDNVRHGDEIHYYNNGAVKRVVPYVRGIVEGDMIKYRPNGDIYNKTTYVDGMQNGIKTVWYNSTQIQSTYTYKNGLLHGDYTCYYANGQMDTKCNYTRSKRHGTELKWDILGRLTISTNYTMGYEEGEKITYDYQLGRRTTQIYNGGYLCSTKFDKLSSAGNH